MDSFKTDSETTIKNLEIVNCQQLQFGTGDNLAMKQSIDSKVGRMKAPYELSKNKKNSSSESNNSGRSTIFSDGEGVQQLILLKLLEKKIISDLYQNAVLNLLDEKTNADLMKDIDLEKITSYFREDNEFENEMTQNLLSKKKNRGGVVKNILKNENQKSNSTRKGKLRALKPIKQIKVQS